MARTAPEKTAFPSLSQQRQGASIHPLWLRISAFLSLKSHNTQVTYLGIIHEWCAFLGATAGTDRSATLFIKASDMEAIGYREWLLRQKGQRPRLFSKPSQTKAVLKETIRPRSRPQDGLQETLSNATIAKKFAALRRIYRMVMANSLGVSENPFDADRVSAPARTAGQKRPTEMLSFDLVKEIINIPDASSPKGLRDRVILQILFGAGLRRSEVITIRIGDVRKTPRGTMYIKLRATKAKRDADQALPRWATADVEKLLAARKKEGASPADYLFVSFTGQGGTTPTDKPLSASGLYKLFKAYCLRAGAGQFVSPHSARATAITRLLSQGLSHREVQEFSRHASVQMVEVYDKRRYGVDENPAKDLDYD